MQIDDALDLVFSLPTKYPPVDRPLLSLDPRDGRRAIAKNEDAQRATSREVRDPGRGGVFQGVR